MQYRFYNFTLDTAQLYLTADGVPVEADARQLQLLRLLIDAYPEPCSQPQLLEKLWPDTVVSHWSAGRLVSDTRKLFRGLGYEGPLIQTLHGRGYRLAPELVEQLRELPEVTAAAEDSPLAERPPANTTRFLPATAQGQHDAAERSVSRSLAAHWRILAAMGLLLLLVALVVHFNTARRTPGADAPLVIGEAPDARGRILWVDDNPGNNLAERQQLESLGIAVYIVTNTEDALVLLSMYRYDAVISDMGRGGEPLAGVKLMERIRARGDKTPYFLYTIMPSEALGQLIAQRGGNGVAVTAAELFDMVLPLFDEEASAPAAL